MRKIQRSFLGAGLAAVALMVAACGQTQQRASAPVGCVLDSLSQIGGPISLVGADGAPVTEATFAGRSTLVYFGFAHCPDVCPMAMQSAEAALAQLPAEQRPMPVLITLDPERDTPEAMATYTKTPGFPADLVGLSGSVQQTSEAAQRFKVSWRKTDGADYLIEHGSYFYVLDPTWRLRGLFASVLPPEEAATCIRMALQAA